MAEILIPLPVARQVVSSTAFQEKAAALPGMNVFSDIVKRGRPAKWLQSFRYDSEQVIARLRDTVALVEEEFASAGAPLSVYGQLTLFRTELDQRVVAQAELDKIANELALEAVEQEKVRWRRERTISRAQTMTGSIEGNRASTLKEICEDFGLDPRDSNIMAALISAFHEGADAFRNVVMTVGVIDREPVPAEWLEKRQNADKLIFARAGIDL